MSHPRLIHAALGMLLMVAAGCGGGGGGSSSGTGPVATGPGPAITVISIPNNNFGFPGVGGQGTNSHEYDPANASWAFTAQSFAGGNPSGSGVAACPGDGFTPVDPNPPGGAQVAFIQGQGTISQSISTFQAGIRYIIRFYAIQRENNSQTIRVSVDGVTLADMTPPSDTSFTLMSTPPFTVTGGSHTVQFAGSNPNSGDNTGLIDLVSIVPIGSNNVVALQNSTTNQVALWSVWDYSVNNTGTIAQTPSAQLKVVGLADMNQDGSPDLIFQNQSTGQLAVWYLNGSTVTATRTLAATLPAGWNVVGVSDFSGDGWPDLLVEQPGTGSLALWYMVGASVASRHPISTKVPANTVVAGSGWFSDVTPPDSPWQRTGPSDILLQNTTTGQLTVWHMSGPTLTSTAPVTSMTPAVGQTVNAVAYLSGHAEPDILMTQPGSSTVTDWHFSGGQAGGNGDATGTVDTALPAGWSIVGPR